MPRTIPPNSRMNLKTGRTLDYEEAKDRKLSSLYLSLLDRMGAGLPQFGNAKDHLVGL